jgi:L-alanine-DL-glutamate epimerase-like enolase superfamily enzyme
MRITDIRVDVLTFPHPPGHKWEKGAISATGWDQVIVHVDTDESITGIGEAYHLKNPTVVAEVVTSRLKPLVVGHDPFDVASLWERMFSRVTQIGAAGVAAIAGIDTACWDVIGRALGQPVHRLLGRGGDEPVRVPAYVGGHVLGWQPLDELDKLVEETQGYVDAGFRAIKIRGGRGLPHRGDIESVRALRDAFGDELTILVDANTEYRDYKTALRMCHELDALGVGWIEDCFAFSVAFTSAEMARLAQESPIPVASGGNVFSRFGVKALIAAGGVDVITANTAKTGGISEVRHIQSLASAFNITYTAHCDGGLNTLSNLHVFAAAPPHLTQKVFFEWDPIWPLEELLTHPPVVEDGWITVPDRPGLGSDLVEGVQERRALRADSWFRTEMIGDRV